MPIFGRKEPPRPGLQEVAEALAATFEAAVTDGGRIRVEDLLSDAPARRGEVKPSLDRTFHLDQIVEALHWVDDGNARGKVIVTVAPTPGHGGPVG